MDDELLSEILEEIRARGIEDAYKANMPNQKLYITSTNWGLLLCVVDDIILVYYRGTDNWKQLEFRLSAPGSIEEAIDTFIEKHEVINLMKSRKYS